MTDLVDAHVKLIRVLKENEVFHYNVGNGKPYTVLEIVKVVEKVTKQQIIFAVSSQMSHPHCCHMSKMQLKKGDRAQGAVHSRTNASWRPTDSLH